jgi:hypothetical protein
MFFPIPDPGVKKAPDPGYGFATLILWVIFSLLDPFPGSPLNPDPGSLMNPDLIRIHNGKMT